MKSEKTAVKHRLKICMGSSCFARGNQNNLKVLESLILQHEFDWEIELTGSRCENKCSCGPNIEINGKMYNGIDTGSLIDLLNSVLVPGELKIINEYNNEI